MTPSTVIFKDGHPVTYSIHAFIEFKSLHDTFPYIESQSQRWRGSAILDAAPGQRLGRQLLHEAIESRVVSMRDERPLELLVTHTTQKGKLALAMTNEPFSTGYEEGFLNVQEKWKRTLNCWSIPDHSGPRTLKLVSH